jgi:hypothetical protein
MARAALQGFRSPGIIREKSLRPVKRAAQAFFQSLRAKPPPEKA